MRFALILLCLILSFTGHGQERKYLTVHRTAMLMGGRMDISVVTVNEELGYINIDEAIAEIKRIEKLISSWDPESETSEINANAGIRPVKVGPELYGLIERAVQVSAITDGAFDITFSPAEEVWKFDGSMEYEPTSSQIKASLGQVGYSKIVLNSRERSVFLPKKGMKVTFGAIGKGFAADRAKELLMSKQVVGGVINASGDLTTWGTKASGEKWMVGIVNPLYKDRVVSWLPVLESSVATSGNFEKYVTFKGKRYSHIIDPRTGYPVGGVSSTTVFGRRAELCDALATAVSVMGVDRGMALIEQLGGVEAVIFDDQGGMHKSSGVLFENKP